MTLFLFFITLLKFKDRIIDTVFNLCRKIKNAILHVAEPRYFSKWWTLRDLNPGPAGYEPDALTN